MMDLLTKPVKDEFPYNLNVMEQLQLNTWCCEQLGDRHWNKSVILDMLFNSESIEMFKMKFMDWLEDENKIRNRK